MSEKVNVVTSEDRERVAKRIVSLLKEKSHDLLTVCCEDKKRDGFLLRQLYFEADCADFFINSLVNILSPSKDTGLEDGESIVVFFFGNRRVRLEHRWNKENFFIIEYRIHN